MVKAPLLPRKASPVMGRYRAPLPACTLIVILMSSCAPREVHAPAPAAPPHTMEWIDLQPGWRVRVVTPVIKSGGHLVNGGRVGGRGEFQAIAPISGQASHAATVTLKTANDFVGYEVSLYAVKGRRAGGVRVVFSSAVINRGGKRTVQSKPIVPLFQLPGKDRFVRILHLAWGRRGEHEAAILAANRRNLLDPFTRQVEYHSSACGNTHKVFCSWIPAGIAVIPQRRESGGGEEQWVAAF